MEQYIGIKIVLAEPMTAGEATEKGYLRTNPNEENRQPDCEGYHVKYEDDYHSWCPKNVFEKHNNKIVNHVLAESASLMMSTDYKDRFIAEYNQLQNRYIALRNMCNAWDSGTLPFVPTCSRKIYESQLGVMLEYLCILIRRAFIEDVKLDIDDTVMEVYNAYKIVVEEREDKNNN